MCPPLARPHAGHPLLCIGRKVKRSSYLDRVRRRGALFKCVVWTDAIQALCSAGESSVGACTERYLIVRHSYAVALCGISTTGRSGLDFAPGVGEVGEVERICVGKVGVALLSSPLSHPLQVGIEM